MHQLYDRYKDNMILRDILAVDRTKLANERTLLSYIRTALTLFIVGVSFIKFFDEIILTIIGWIFVPIGVLAGWIGIKRFIKMKKLMDLLLSDKKDTRAITDNNTEA